MSDGYPITLRLDGRRCVVVGGGSVAARKVNALVGTGADVVVVAQEVVPHLQMLADQGRLLVERRRFEPGDLDGAFLAFAATDDPKVNRAVASAARERGVPVNVADDPAGCDFTVPAVVRRGDVMVAISTGGRSPAFARHLRTDLDRWLTPERCALLDLAADLRHELRADGQAPDAEDWQRALDDPEVQRALTDGDRDAARERLLVALRPEP
jgi:precorrin-2 dehydrogenase/sirohydrochlorin ferrochelatase